MYVCLSVHVCDNNIPTSSFQTSCEPSHNNNQTTDPISIFIIVVNKKQLFGSFWMTSKLSVRTHSISHTYLSLPACPPRICTLHSLHTLLSFPLPHPLTKYIPILPLHLTAGISTGVKSKKNQILLFAVAPKPTRIIKVAAANTFFLGAQSLRLGTRGEINVRFLIISSYTH